MNCPSKEFVLQELAKETGDAKVARLNELLVEEYVGGGCTADQAPKVFAQVDSVNPKDDPRSVDGRLVLRYPFHPGRYADDVEGIVDLVW